MSPPWIFLPSPFNVVGSCSHRRKPAPVLVTVSLSLTSVPFTNVKVGLKSVILSLWSSSLSSGLSQALSTQTFSFFLLRHNLSSFLSFFSFFFSSLKWNDAYGLNPGVNTVNVNWCWGTICYISKTSRFNFLLLKLWDSMCYTPNYSIGFKM